MLWPLLCTGAVRMLTTKHEDSRACLDLRWSSERARLSSRCSLTAGCRSRCTISCTAVPQSEVHTAGHAVATSHPHADCCVGMCQIEVKKHARGSGKTHAHGLAQASSAPLTCRYKTIKAKCLVTALSSLQASQQHTDTRRFQAPASCTVAKCRVCVISWHTPKCYLGQMPREVLTVQVWIQS